MIAGGGVRAVLELAGYRDVLTKSIGTNNPINQVKATMAGLKALRKPEDVAELRGLSVNQVLGLDQEAEGRRGRRGRGRGREAVDAVAVATAEAPPEAAADRGRGADPRSRCGARGARPPPSAEAPSPPRRAAPEAGRGARLRWLS